MISQYTPNNVAPIPITKKILYFIGGNMIKPPEKPPKIAPKKHTIPQSPPIEKIITKKIIIPKMRANCFRMRNKVDQLIVKYERKPPKAP